MLAENPAGKGLALTYRRAGQGMSRLSIDCSPSKTSFVNPGTANNSSLIEIEQEEREYERNSVEV